jgi:hypothetical protein
MNREKFASELLKIAKELTNPSQPTKNAGFPRGYDEYIWIEYMEDEFDKFAQEMEQHFDLYEKIRADFEKRDRKLDDLIGQTKKKRIYNALPQLIKAKKEMDEYKAYLMYHLPEAPLTEGIAGIKSDLYDLERQISKQHEYPKHRVWEDMG